MYSYNTIAALKEGDEYVFSEIFNNLHAKVYFYILSRLKSDYLAEEVTQLTFIKLWRYRQSLNEDLSISIQVFRIAKTTCIDQLRKEAKKAEVPVPLGLGSLTTNNVVDRIEERELHEKLALAVQKLPPMRKKVFELSRFEAKTYKEISQLLSLSEKTVENHLTLALRQLRRIFFLLLFCFFL